MTPRATRRRRGTGRRRSRGQVQRFGVAVEIRIERRDGRMTPAIRRRRVEKFFCRPAGRSLERILGLVDDGVLSSRVAGIAHRKRLSIVKAIASGADTHRALSRAVNIATGPLYFHLRALERGQLVAMRERNRYAVTPACVDMLLVLSVVLSWPKGRGTSG